MSEWEKKENRVEQPSDNTETESSSESALSSRRSHKRRSNGRKSKPTPTETNPEMTEEAVPTSEREEEDESRSADTGTMAEPQRSPLRYTSSGRRRGRYRLAAPLGLLVLVLAVIGVVSLIGTGVNAIKKAQDDTPLKSELNDFLSPVMQYKPQAFTNVNETKQDALLLAAIWRVTDAENIRQKKENTSVSNYPMDDLGRLLIPVSEIEQSYSYLFGSSAVPYHHTIGDDGKSFTTEYDKDQGLYHVPFISTSSLYVPVIDTLKKKGDTITVRVGYVLSTKIGVDDKGKSIDPTPDMADEFQKYTVKKNGEQGWILTAVEDEKSTTSSTAGSTGSTETTETTQALDVTTAPSTEATQTPAA